ncbi:transcriptional regulator [Xanthomonas phage Kintu]
MTDTNATTLRNALAAAVKNHVESNGMTAKDAAAAVDVQLSRFYQVLRGEVSKISSDALVNMLGGLGYRMTAINGSGDGTEIVLSLDKAEKVLPEIEKPDFPKNEVEAGKPFPVEVGHMVDGELVPDGIVLSDALEVDPDAGRVVNDDE